MTRRYTIASPATVGVCLLIERIRRDLGLTQAAFAEALGVSTMSISMWEGGRTRPRRVVWERLRDYVEEARGADSGTLLEIDDATTRDWLRR